MDATDIKQFADAVLEYEWYDAQGWEISDWCWHSWANWREHHVVWC